MYPSLSKPCKNVCCFRIYQVALINKSAYKKLKQQKLNTSIYFRDYKSGQVLGNTYRDKKDCKYGQLKGLQIWAKSLQIGTTMSNRGKEISNRGRDPPWGKERLQTGTGISNRGRDYKLLQNKIRLSTEFIYPQNGIIRKHKRFVEIIKKKKKITGQSLCNNFEKNHILNEELPESL